MKKRPNSRTDGELSRWNQFELALYRCLGVPQFRKGVLALEGLRHHRDGGKNPNYHIRSLTVRAAGGFRGYLWYHTLLHLVSLLLGGLFFFLLHCFQRRGGPLELLVGLVCILNIWCILLQRYNGLRIRALCLRRRQSLERRIAREAGARACHMPPGYRTDQMEEDFRLIRRIAENLRTGRTVRLGEENAPGLLRMAGLAPGNGRKERTSGGEQEGQTAGQLLEKLLCPPGRLERRVLRRSIRHFAVVTEGVQVEAAFRKLFDRDDLEALTARAEATAMALERLLQGEAS